MCFPQAIKQAFYQSFCPVLKGGKGIIPSAHRKSNKPVIVAFYTPERKKILNNTSNAYKNDIPAVKVVERKIGKATIIVSSRFNNGKEKDIVSTIARLVKHDKDGKYEI